MSETHWKKLSDPNYLGSWDFSKGEERILTISRVVVEEVFNPSSSRKEMCTVAHFSEKSLPMILNKTNCKMIAKIYGTPFIEKWTGCQVLIGVDKVKAKGELVEALRIRDQKPAKTQTPVPPCHDCNKKIAAMDKYTAEQIVAVNIKRYGVPLCAECSNKRKSEEVKADAVDE